MFGFPDVTSEFDQWWAAYPRKVGKLAAMKAFTKARRLASLEQLLDGITRYTQHKPSYADYCHPVTFLNQGRWLDEPPTPVARRSERAVCPHTPPCPSPGNWQCQQRTVLEQARPKRSNP